ncbi:predicted protein [Sclerotinia sclerotiorum 1980 UF-70]|uniref:Cytidyltransferase-like domain-containing protein n=2 Tax=Sclerotinia sclerotiorum (strain ATCC 18683 / 1980 / Ss-1) TaxID=665079 RepID=A7EHT4_SCLS1|nr:predicted protein [Sclerotinia sclerotiorum 1980 UF-70]APA11472.1 hypothetical protein sscle_08g062420 [Sclerotinia sclerotiorum 1980 UF-70]EDO02400.1 predicted protein [Sclerotinia sclerotiorum 1980 UF-70]
MSANVTDGAENGNPELTAVLNDPHQVRTNTIQPFLQKAMESPINIGEIPASLFSGKSHSNHNLTLQNSHTSCPILESNSRNNILLYPGSFNPPHQGHLATIRYFSERRGQLGVTAIFIFVDPGLIVQGKKKKWGNIILPQELRYELFYRVPKIYQLVESGWLQLLVGDMDTHIKVLRMTTDLISEAGFDVKLVGLLGGDKLTIESAPHLHPGDLQEWGPVDEFLIINARRPVDFFDPKGEEIPRNLPGCTAWEKCTEAEEEKKEQLNESAGVLWMCKALTVPVNPIIRFRASQISASNGVSSTKIRQIMTEAHDEELMEELKDKVISVEFLVEWLLLQRNREREKIDEKAFL